MFLFFWFSTTLLLADEKLSVNQETEKKAVKNLQSLYQKSADLYMAGKIDEAIVVAEEARRLANSNLVASLKQIGLYYRSEAEYEKAEPIYTRLLQHQETVLGLDHPDLVETIHELARVYQSQNKFTKAEVLHKRGIKILEKSKENSPDLGYKIFELGALYEFQNLYDKSATQYLRALKIWEGASEINEQDILQAVGSLARVYRNGKKYAKAEPYYKRMIAITEKAYGKESPYIIYSLEQLERLYELMEKDEEVKLLNSRISEIRLLQKPKKKKKF